MEKSYMIVYMGKLQSSRSSDDVVKKISATFKINKDEAQKLVLSSKPKIIKKGLSINISNKYKIKLEQIGLVVKIIEEPNNKSKNIQNAANPSGHETKNIIVEEQSPENHDHDTWKKIKKCKSNEINSINKTKKNNMGLIGVFIRYILLYSILLIGFSLLLSFFGLKSNSGVNVGVIFGSTMYASFMFGKINKRFFTKEEKIKVIVGLTFINIIIQILFASFIFLLSTKDLDKIRIFSSIGINIVIYTAVIYFVIGRVKKRLISQGLIEN